MKYFVNFDIFAEIEANQNKRPLVAIQSINLLVKDTDLGKVEYLEPILLKRFEDEIRKELVTEEQKEQILVEALDKYDVNKKIYDIKEDLRDTLKSYLRSINQLNNIASIETLDQETRTQLVEELLSTINYFSKINTILLKERNIEKLDLLIKKINYSINNQEVLLKTYQTQNISLNSNFEKIVCFINENESLKKRFNDPYYFEYKLGIYLFLIQSRLDNLYYRITTKVEEIEFSNTNGLIIKYSTTNYLDEKEYSTSYFSLEIITQLALVEIVTSQFMPKLISHVSSINKFNSEVRIDEDIE